MENEALTISVTDTSQVSFSDAVCTINPTNNLDDRGGKVWTLRIDSGVIQDIPGLDFAGNTEELYYISISDVRAPTALQLFPVHQATGQPNDVSVLITFDEHVQVNGRPLI